MATETQTVSGDGFGSVLRKYSDGLLGVGVLGLMVTLIMPMPPLMLDLLLALNISSGVLLLVLTMNAKAATELSTFPTILLFSTLFRLGLNVASTRLILTGGQAGSIITAFGNYVAGNNLGVGLVVFLILIGASLFALVFRAYGGDHYVEALLTGIPGGLWGALAITMLVMFILGFFLDFIEIVFVVVPIVAPPLIILGADPVWLAILMALNLQTSFLTPPFGFALFYLRGAAPDGVATMDIWRGAIPFIGLQLFMIAMVAAIPALATWLPTFVR